MDHPGLELSDLPASVPGASHKDVCPFAQIYFCVLVFLEGLTYDMVNETGNSGPLFSLQPHSVALPLQKRLRSRHGITENILSLMIVLHFLLKVVCPDCSDEIAVKKDNILVRSFKDGKL